MSGRRAYPHPPTSNPGQYATPSNVPQGGQFHPMQPHQQYPSMVPSGNSLAGPTASAVPSQLTYHHPPMFNSTAAANTEQIGPSQPPSMMPTNVPAHVGRLLPPPSNAGTSSLQQQQFPPPPKPGVQPPAAVQRSQQHLPNQFPPTHGTGSTQSPVGLPPQQIATAPGQFAMLPNTKTQPVNQTMRTRDQLPSQSVGGGHNRPPIMSTMVAQPTQPFSHGTVGAPPMLAQHNQLQSPPTSSTIASNTFMQGPLVSGMTSTNISQQMPPRPSPNFAGPPFSTGNIQAGMRPPGPVSSAGAPLFSGGPTQQLGGYQQRLPPPPQASIPPPPTGGAPIQSLSALSAAGKRVYPQHQQSMTGPGAMTMTSQPQPVNQPAGHFIGQHMPAMSGLPAGQTGVVPGQVGPAQNQMTMSSGQMNVVPGHVGVAHTQMGGMTTQMGGMSLNQSIPPSLQPCNLLEVKNILPADPLNCQDVDLPAGMSRFAPNPKVMCSTINAVPESQSMLGKLKLPLGIHIHPFQSLTSQECPVLQPRTIIRCRMCRTYLNPFVSFIDSRHWRCNLCFRPNDLPEEIGFNPQTKRIGEKCRRAELLHSSVEYIAPSEYMVRPPQPSVYYFLIDVSYNSILTGMLGVFCSVLLDNLAKLPGDARTMVGFLTYDSALHFYNLKSSLAQPQMMVVTEIDDIFLPSPNSLLVNLRESKELVQNLLEEIPKMFAHNQESDSALGAALQAGYKLLFPYGGRITVLQTTIPNIGPGALKFKDDDMKTTSQGKEKLTLSPSTDFYKKLALDCSAQQIGVDLFLMSSRYSDLSTIACIAKFSSGQISYYPDFHLGNVTLKRRFEKNLEHYFTRRVGFEAVMRIRCTQGLALHTFHGNFFVRSTDLLSLPNVNPDMSYAFNMVIEENMKDVGIVCVQAALLYTSSQGERRIRVHTLALPVTDKFSELYSACNVTAIVGLLGKMAVDRVMSASLGDAREALVNAVVDATKMYRTTMLSSTQQRLFCLPQSLQLLPLFVLAMLKNPAFSLSPKVTLDYRAHVMNLFKTVPLDLIITYVYPKLYGVHNLTEKDLEDTKENQFAKLPILQLNSQFLTRQGVYIMDAGMVVYIWIAKAAPEHLITQLFDVASYEDLSEDKSFLPALDNPLSETVHVFIRQLRSSRPFYLPVHVVKEDSTNKMLFIESLLEDRTESTMAYHEFLTFIQKQLEK